LKPLWYKDDIGAATVGALATLPQAVAYGLIVVSPLGAEWAAFGISVSVATAIAYGFFTGLFTTHPFMVSGPKAVLALVIAAGIQSALGRGETPENALFLGFAGVIVAGAFQIASGVLRLGHVVSYVPVPVLAGFMNASALLVMLSSVPMVLGVPEMTVEQLLAGGIVDASLWALGVSGLTIIVNFLAEGRVRFLPAALIGLIAGAAVYYAGIAGLGLPQGPEVGHIDLASLLQLPMLFTHADPVAVLMRAPDIPLLTGLSIGLLTSFDTVLSSGSLNIDDGGKPDANHDLRVHGAANFVMGVLGYMPGSGTLSRSMAIINAGAKTRAANAGVGIVFLIMLVVLAPVVAALPLWATAGMLLATAVQAFDKGTLANIRRIIRREVPYPRILAGDLAVTFVVVVTALIFNLIAAVGVGIVLAVVLFVLGVGRNPVRRVLLGSRVRSKVQRRPEQIALLEQEGHRIAVIEVQGALFFGACAQLQSVAERQIALGAAYLILDFRHVTSIDSTGTALLRTLNIQCREQGGRLSLSYIQPERRLKIVEQRRDENGSEAEDMR
jgi:SulP family sulfate permease